MGSHILMNVVDEQELRVGVIRDGKLEALIHERIGEGQHLGNIYKARVANVEPSLDAAFLDLGAGKNGFIHIDEVIHAKGGGARIEQALHAGQEIIVQITKEAIKDKGPCVSMYLSVPGRYLVMMNSEQAKGVSKRIEDPAVRKRLKGILSTFEPPEGMGFIVRTASADRRDDEIRLDYEFLKRLWAEILALQGRARAPFCLYQEADVVVRTLRDLASADAQAIVIDEEKLYDEARAFAQVFMPELCDRIQLHREELPLFTFYGLEDRVATIYERKVQLPSGGTIVIEQTEALVSIDVNSARNRDAGDVETTALMTNLEATQTIAQQLVLRDLGGLIIIDFIDMEDREHQKLVQLALRRAMIADKAKIQVGPLSRFGLVEMTRQRTRPSHKLLASTECPYCTGTGSIKTTETFEIDCMRAVRQALSGKNLSRLEVVVPQDLALTVLNARHRELHELEERSDCRIVFTADGQIKAREFRLVPTARKGERRDRGQHPVRPSLLAPLMVEQAKAMTLAKELAAMKPDDLERELEEGSASPQVQAAAQAAAAAVAAAATP
ncbi:MAG: Rne/Rng family ribonuclease, partial [Planctomycetes bacterium]|nr:Rne/Rng family ribonuclease [Planctomycetota bacterium]